MHIAWCYWIALGLILIALEMAAAGGFYITQFGHLAKESNTMILPANASDVGSMIALAMKSIQVASPGTPPR